MWWFDCQSPERLLIFLRSPALQITYPSPEVSGVSTCCSVACYQNVLSFFLFYFLLSFFPFLFSSYSFSYYFNDNVHLILLKNNFVRVTNLFIVPNYLFPLHIKLFSHVDSFVRDIYFSLFILTIKCSRSLMFRLLNIIICSLCLNFWLFVF